jgi:hypothetical protein
MDARLNIFTGHFGSGKSEIAVNYAIKLKEEGKNVILADMDLVNTFFRSSDASEPLVAAGIRLIRPVYANTNVDIPVIPAEINTIFDDKTVTAVMDAGGDDIGARALGRYKAAIEKEGYSMFYVINPNRPFAGTPELIMEMMKEISASSRLEITFLVCNANLLANTTTQTVLGGLEIVIQVSAATGIPIAFTAGFGNILDKLPEDIGTELFYMKKLMKQP